jgi:hypothetical protein
LRRIDHGHYPASVNASVLGLASGTVGDWLGRSGKILLVVAGLAVLLDLVGHR